MTPCPFEIIQTANAAHMLHVQEHENNDGFNAGDLEAHCNLLIVWCLAVGQESIPETCYSLFPDYGDLKKHKANTHSKHIQPTLKRQQQHHSIQPKQCECSSYSEPT